MPRNRMIKADAFRSRHLAQVPIAVRWTFAGLWTLADDEGRLTDDAEAIAADLYLRDREMTPEAVEEHLNLLTEAGLICRYKVGSRAFLHMPTWHRHQKVNNPSAPRYPPCPADHTDDEGTLFPSSDYETTVALPEPSVSPKPKRKEKENINQTRGRARERDPNSDFNPGYRSGTVRLEEATEERAEASDRRTADTAEMFGEFYRAYPRHQAPQAARRAWDKAVKTADPQVIIAAARRYAGWCERNRKDRQFIAMPATWLNQGRWDDELEDDTRDESLPDW